MSCPTHDVTDSSILSATSWTQMLTDEAAQIDAKEQIELGL
jgi:hypothetical protein